MANMHKVGTHKTTVTNQNGVITTTYVSTKVCTIDTNTRTITLNNGGWFTPTTKNRINQTLNEYLPNITIFVYQKDGEWFVFDGCYDVPFVNNMKLKY